MSVGSIADSRHGQRGSALGVEVGDDELVMLASLWLRRVFVRWVALRVVLRPDCLADHQQKHELLHTPPCLLNSPRERVPQPCIVCKSGSHGTYVPAGTQCHDSSGYTITS